MKLQNNTDLEFVNYEPSEELMLNNTNKGEPSYNPKAHLNFLMEIFFDSPSMYTFTATQRAIVETVPPNSDPRKNYVYDLLEEDPKLIWRQKGQGDLGFNSGVYSIFPSPAAVPFVAEKAAEKLLFHKRYYDLFKFPPKMLSNEQVASTLHAYNQTRYSKRAITGITWRDRVKLTNESGLDLSALSIMTDFIQRCPTLPIWTDRITIVPPRLVPSITHAWDAFQNYINSMQYGNAMEYLRDQLFHPQHSFAEFSVHLREIMLYLLDNPNIFVKPNM